MKITVTEAENGITIKQYLIKNRFSARLITALKTKERGITVNGERRTVRYQLTTGDILELETEDSVSSENIRISRIPIRILYEDDWYIAVEKPAGLPVHPSRDLVDDTLASRVMAHFEGRPFVFRVLTRLDRDTSGVVIIAKDSMSASRFSEMLTRRQVHKEYIAVCDGIPDTDSGIIDFNIRRPSPYRIEREAVPKGEGNGESSPEGAQALSEYRVLKSGRGHCLMKLSPITGRTHQLRIHTGAIGHPIIGDTLYFQSSPYISRQALHAERLVFTHPMTGEETTVECPLPEDILFCIKELFDD